jgi:hypothetical protein
MSGSPFDIFSPLFFFSAGEPSTVELVAPNIWISLSALLDCFISQESIFTQLHNARLTLSGFSNELRPQ